MIECLDLSLGLVIIDFGHWWMGSLIWKINDPIDDGFMMVEGVFYVYVWFDDGWRRAAMALMEIEVSWEKS